MSNYLYLDTHSPLRQQQYYLQSHPSCSCACHHPQYSIHRNGNGRMVSSMAGQVFPPPRFNGALHQVTPPQPSGGGRSLDPRAQSFFSTYPMGAALADILPSPPKLQQDYRQHPDRIQQTLTPDQPHRFNQRDIPPHLGIQRRDEARLSPIPTGSGMGVSMGTTTVIPTDRDRRNTSSHTYLNSNLHPPDPNPNSTTLYIGPIPPMFTINQIHAALRGFTPRVALFDFRLGVMEVELPFKLTSQQISDWCQRGLSIGDIIIPVSSGVSTGEDRRWS